MHPNFLCLYQTHLILLHTKRETFFPLAEASSASRFLASTLPITLTMASLQDSKPNEPEKRR